jgi:hypothetical protein
MNSFRNLNHLIWEVVAEVEIGPIKGSWGIYSVLRSNKNSIHLMLPIQKIVVHVILNRLNTGVERDHIMPNHLPEVSDHLFKLHKSEN